MEPKSLSASAMQTFELCPARYHAENILRNRGIGNRAAMLGTSVHGGLETYVKKVFLEKSVKPSKNLLLMFYKASYMETFNTMNTDTIEYMEGYQMTVEWFDRNEASDYFNSIVGVVSCEVKENFPITTSIGPIPYNYIWDRFDQVGERKFKVVDYKTNRWNVSTDELKKKIQPRSYGLACAIQLKAQGIEYDEIWVEFDMLRHGGPRGVLITHDDNVQMWNYLKRKAQEIVDTPDKDANGDPVFIEERLNDQCNFCTRKAGCKALSANITSGGIHSIPNVEAAIDLRANVEYQLKALNSFMKELDQKILSEAKERDQDIFASDMHDLQIVLSNGNRTVDPDMVVMAIGPKLFEKYGSRNISMKSVDTLLKGKELTPEQKQQLRSLIGRTTGEPKVKITPKDKIGGP